MQTRVAGALLVDNHTLFREGLRGVLRGEAALSGTVAAEIPDEFGRHQASGLCRQVILQPVEPLTERELQILRLVAEGLSNKEIGARLFLSDQTIKKQLSGVLQKLHLNNRVQAAAYAVRNGLAD